MCKSKICEYCKVENCSVIYGVSKCKKYKKIRKLLQKRKKFEEERESLRVSKTEFKCKNPKCTKLHDGKYAVGIFCSKHCACQYAILVNGNSLKIQKHRKSLVDRKILIPKERSPYGTWKCDICDQIFETRRLLRQHFLQSGHKKNNPLIKNDGTFECPHCGKIFSKKESVYGHIFQCKKNPMYDSEKDKLRHEKSASKLRERYHNGELKSIWKGKHLPKDTRIKLRETTLRYLEKTYGCSHRYNKKSIPIIESIAKEHGWNFQHAEKGGEFYTGIGFYVDAYDKEKNIVLEYDERDHYKDVKNNILKDKDLERQKEIIEHLHCEFWRYNEYTNNLWKVN